MNDSQPRAEPFQPVAQARGAAPTRKRFHILGLVFISVIINYMDRTNISVAAAALSDELSLSPVQMGLIFSAFGWTYSALQIPGGILVDQVKIR
ncbi:MAG: MFS transporter, partial [Pseudomonadota bacterium]